MTESTILIVDDIEANRQTLESLLDYPELQLHHAADGATALARAAELQPDLILLDVMMPGMDGFEICRQLRSDPQLAEVPILMVSALDDRESRLRGIDAGADDFVTKPFDRAELRARIRGILRLNRFRRLQQANERTREQAALVDLAPDAIIVCSLSQRITYWNPAAERLYGWRAEEVLGQRADILLSKKGNAETEGAESFSNDEWRGEVTQITRDKKEIVVDSRRKVWRDTSGKPKAMLTINTDLTEKKQLEAQFLRAQRLESIGTLASGIAHDLNNILAPIMMSIEIMRMRLEDADSKEMCDTLEACAQRGANLIRQILSFARGSGNKKSEVQLRHLVDAIVKMLRGALPPDIEIKAEFSDELWPVMGNAGQLDQVLMNLCVNARDAMPQGGKLRISLGNAIVTELDCARIPAARPGDYVRVTVADTGTGMPPEVVGRIFDAFFTTKAQGEGTGLGLATVQTVVNGHEGFLTVESALGRGTSFTVYFPAVAAATTAESSEWKATELPCGHGERLLIVDDEEAFLDATAATLEEFGYRTLKAADGVEAVKCYSQHSGSIRLVMTDLRMPKLDGSRLAHTLRRFDRGLPIVLVSGAVDGRDAEDDGDVTEFLQKPLAAADLLHTIQRLLAPAA